MQSLFYNAGQGYDDRHGLDRGPLLLDGERWDFNEPETLKSLRSGVAGGDDNRWYYDIQDRLVEVTLNGVTGVGLINNVAGPREGWAYTPTLTD